MAENVISLAKYIIRQDPVGKIMLAETSKGQLSTLQISLTQVGFTPALRGGLTPIWRATS